MEAAPIRTLIIVIIAIATAITACSVPQQATYPTEAAQSAPVEPMEAAPVVATTTGPDITADTVGGMAARMHLADGTPVPGRLFQLMAIQGSEATVRVYDETAFVHDNGIHPITSETLDSATEIAADIAGAEIERIDMTTAAGGGDSAGLLYVLSHLQLITDGALAGDIELAATAALTAEGRLAPISAPDEKLAAAAVAGVDVVFTSTQPSADAIEAVDGRWVNVPRRTRTGDVAADRGWDEYRSFGAERTGLDVVGVRHVGDAVAYLCGAGSAVACDLLPAVAGLAVESAGVAQVAVAPASAPAGVR